MIEKAWRTLNGDSVDLRSALEDELRLVADAKVIIACDSQQVGQNTDYCTVVIVHRPAKGGRVFFCRERIPRVRELRERLWKEAWRSTELAMELTSTPDIGSQFPINVHEIHIDANVDPRHKSSKYVEELAGLVMGQGFKAVVKPDAFGASHAADHCVKHKDERRKPHADGKARRRRYAA